MRVRCFLGHIGVLLIMISCVFFNSPGRADELKSTTNVSVDDQINQAAEESRLQRGEVVVELIEQGATKFVVAKILIDQPPSAVWAVVANPFEFERKIVPRLKRVELLQDSADQSEMKCSLDLGFFMPKITYVVQSIYQAPTQVDFHRTGGIIKDFRGSWILRPREGGSSTEISYSMFVDPGIPLPHWIVREAVKAELPNTLLAVRKRVHEVCDGAAAQIKTIQAVSAFKTPLASRKGSI